METNKLKAVPAWLELNKDRTEAKVLRKPTREDVDLEVQESLIVELYSKNYLNHLIKLYIIRVIRAY